MFLYSTLFASGQTNCKHNVSTNFESPANDALPNNSSLYLNYFNWFPTTIVGGIEVPANYVVDDMIVSGIPITALSSIVLTSIKYTNK